MADEAPAPVRLEDDPAPTRPVEPPAEERAPRPAATGTAAPPDVDHGPIAGGLLSGKYRRDVEAPAGSRHLTEWNEPPVYDEDKLYDTVEELVAIGADHGVSAAQVALAYTLAKPAVTSVIVGARTEDQLGDNLASAELSLSADEVDRLDKVSAQPLPYPFWHQAKTSGGRLSPADRTLLARHV